MERIVTMGQAMRRVLAVAMVPLLWAGCILPIGPEDLRLALSRSSGMKLQQEIGLSVDGLTLTVVGGLAGVPIPLHHLLWADVGIYRVTNPSGEEDTGDTFVMPELRGWKRFVRMRENDEDVQLFVLEFGDAIHGMVFIVRNEDEVVIVRLPETSLEDGLLTLFS